MSNQWWSVKRIECYIGLDTHSLIWRPSQVADTPSLYPVSRWSHGLFVSDMCMLREVLQPGCSGLPLGLVPCWRLIIKSNVLSVFLTYRWPWEASCLWWILRYKKTDLYILMPISWSRRRRKLRKTVIHRYANGIRRLFILRPIYWSVHRWLATVALCLIADNNVVPVVSCLCVCLSVVLRLSLSCSAYLLLIVW